MNLKISTLCCLTLGVSASALSLSAVAHASPTVVTFNPGIAVAGQQSFVADKLNLLTFAQVDLGSTMNNKTSFTDHGYLQLNNTSFHNVTTNPVGNGTAYTIYFDFFGTGTQSASDFTASSQGTFNTLNYTMYEAAGASTFGIVANSPHVTNNGPLTVLATGSMINGTTSFSAAPLGAGANVTETFVQQLAGFILAPANETLTMAGAFNNDSNIVTLNGTKAFTLNGGGGDITFTATVPEPGTWALLGAGLIGLGLVRRRSR